MIDEKALCQKIQEIYPDIGRCSIDVDVEFDSEKGAWLVHLEKDGKRLSTYLEEDEAGACMLGRQCVSLGLQLAELVQNIKERPETRQSPGV